MFIQNRLASLIYKLVIVVVSVVSIILNTGLTNGTFAPYVLLYYTLLSSIMCFIFYTVSAIVTGVNISKTGNHGVIRFAPHFKGAIVMGMLLASVIYFFVLADSFTSVFSTVANVLAHLLLPLMVLVDWALFDRKGRFSGSDPIIWLVIPFAYYGLVLLGAQFGVRYYGGARYPYRFINPDINTADSAWAPVLFNIILICAIYIIVGYILLGVDRLLGNKAKKAALAQAAQLAEETAPPAEPAPAYPADGAAFTPTATPASAPSAAPTSLDEPLVATQPAVPATEPAPATASKPEPASATAIVPPAAEPIAPEKPSAPTPLEADGELQSLQDILNSNRPADK